MKLEDLIGKDIAALIPCFNQEPARFHLHGVETSGLWLESEAIIETARGVLSAEEMKKKLVFFVPFEKITFIFRPI